MNPFPEEWELLSLFEGEPEMTHPRIPWYCNTLTFETTRGENRIRCEIEPADEQIRLYWWQDREERLSLDLHWVRGLEVFTSSEGDYFVASLRDESLANLESHLKPSMGHDRQVSLKVLLRRKNASHRRSVKRSETHSKAERGGFEPPLALNALDRISNPALSATQPSLQVGKYHGLRCCSGRNPKATCSPLLTPP